MTLASLVLLHLRIRSLNPSYILPCHVYNPLSVHFFKETKRLSWPQVETYPLMEWSQQFTPQPVSGGTYICCCRRKRYLTFIWEMFTRLLYQFISNTCEGLTFLSMGQPCFKAVSAVSGVAQISTFTNQWKQKSLFSKCAGFFSDFKATSYFWIVQGKECTWNTFDYYYYLSVYKITIIYRSCLLSFLTSRSHTTSKSGSQVPFHKLGHKWWDEVTKIMGKVVKN